MSPGRYRYHPWRGGTDNLHPAPSHKRVNANDSPPSNITTSDVGGRRPQRGVRGRSGNAAAGPSRNIVANDQASHGQSPAFCNPTPPQVNSNAPHHRRVGENLEAVSRDSLQSTSKRVPSETSSVDIIVSNAAQIQLDALQASCWAREASEARDSEARLLKAELSKAGLSKAGPSKAEPSKAGSSKVVHSSSKWDDSGQDIDNYVSHKQSINNLSKRRPHKSGREPLTIHPNLALRPKVSLHTTMDFPPLGSTSADPNSQEERATTAGRNPFSSSGHQASNMSSERKSNVKARDSPFLEKPAPLSPSITSSFVVVSSKVPEIDLPPASPIPPHMKSKAEIAREKEVARSIIANKSNLMDSPEMNPALPPHLQPKWETPSALSHTYKKEMKTPSLSEKADVSEILSFNSTSDMEMAPRVKIAPHLQSAAEFQRSSKASFDKGQNDNSRLGNKTDTSDVLSFNSSSDIEVATKAKVPPHRQSTAEFQRSLKASDEKKQICGSPVKNSNRHDMPEASSKKTSNIGETSAAEIPPHMRSSWKIKSEDETSHDTCLGGLSLLKNTGRSEALPTLNPNKKSLVDIATASEKSNWDKESNANAVVSASTNTVNLNSLNIPRPKTHTDAATMNSDRKGKSAEKNTMTQQEFMNMAKKASDKIAKIYTKPKSSTNTASASITQPKKDADVKKIAEVENESTAQRVFLKEQQIPLVNENSHHEGRKHKRKASRDSTLRTDSERIAVNTLSEVFAHSETKTPGPRLMTKGKKKVGKLSETSTNDDYLWMANISKKLQPKPDEEKHSQLSSDRKISLAPFDGEVETRNANDAHDADDAKNSLAGWDGKMLPAPLDDEWALRNAFDADDPKHKAGIANWARDQSGVIPDGIDLDAPAFLTGQGIVDGDAIMQKAIEASLHDAYPDRLTVNDPKRLRSTEEAIKERLDSHGAILEELHEKKDRGDLKTKMSKKEQKAQLKFWIDVVEQAGNRPNEYAPKANIYMRPAKADDMRLINNLHSLFISKSVATHFTIESTAASWLGTYNDCVKCFCPFFVAILPQSPKKIMRAQDVVRDKDESVVGFAYATDFGAMDNALKATLEIEIWVHPAHQRLGIGATLMDRMLACTDPMYSWKDPAPFLHNDNPAKWMGGGLRKVETLMTTVLYADEDKDIEWKSGWLYKNSFKLMGRVPDVANKHNKSVHMMQFYYKTGHAKLQ